MSDIEYQHDPDGVPSSVPEKSPDATLRLTDQGLEMPEFLRSYVGTFTVRTANTTAEFETADVGLPDEDYYDGIIAIYPGDGDYHADLREGIMAISTEQLETEAIYTVVDEREELEE